MTAFRPWLLPVVLAVVCAGLGLVLWGQLERTEQATEAALGSETPDPSAEAPADWKRTRVQPIGTYTQALTRPLFLPSRRAPEAGSADGLAGAGMTLPFILQGTMLAGDRGIALLRREDGNIVRLEMGEDIDGWTLEEVRLTSVVLRRGEAEKELPLTERESEQGEPDRAPARQQENEKT